MLNALGIKQVHRKSDLLSFVHLIDCYRTVKSYYCADFAINFIQKVSLIFFHAITTFPAS